MVTTRTKTSGSSVPTLNPKKKTPPGKTPPNPKKKKTPSPKKKPHKKEKANPPPPEKKKTAPLERNCKSSKRIICGEGQN